MPVLFSHDPVASVGVGAATVFGLVCVVVAACDDEDDDCLLGVVEVAAAAAAAAAADVFLRIMPCVDAFMADRFLGLSKNCNTCIFMTRDKL
jgi:spore coat polysaccharide biosynthesis protein SpsF (cytidylyltransferase family)